MEIEKDRHLKACSGNFDAMIEITDEMRNMLRWWIDNVSKHPRFISGVKPFLVIKTDSSLSGWGAINENNGECIQGAWSEDDKNHHINFLELKAITTFGEPLSNCHIRICLDNTVSVSYIIKMGGKIQSLNDLSKTIWHFCADRNIWLSACHVPGVENIEADFLSRSRNCDLEWMLDKGVFQRIMQIYGSCDIDLFASKVNYQFMPYASYGPDKNAKYVDAFSNQWDDLKSYIFCPFSLMGHVLQKLRTDQAEAPNLVDAALVPSAFTDDLPTELSPSEQNRSIGSTDRTEPKTPPSKNETRSFPCLRKAFEKRGLSEETKKILMSSWRESTKKQYRSYQKKWMSFCYERNLDILKRALCGGQSLVYSLRHRNPTKRYLEIR